jgi:hypothetical protein
MVIVINGTKGIGKTSVAQALCIKFPDAVVVMTDNADFTAGALEFIENRRKNGVLVFVTDVIFTDPEQLKEFSVKTKDFCFSFYLNANFRTFRNDPAAVAIADQQRPFCQGELLGMLVEINGLNADAIAEHLAQTIDQQIGC